MGRIGTKVFEYRLKSASRGFPSDEGIVRVDAGDSIMNGKENVYFF